MTEHKHEREDGLSALFEAARAEAPEPSVAFLARVLEDAEVEQARFGAAPEPGPAVARGGFWRAFAGVFGGWRGLGGMATAALAGVWIGFAGGETLTGYLGTESAVTSELGTIELLPAGEEFAALFDEEG